MVLRGSILKSIMLIAFSLVSFATGAKILTDDGRNCLMPGRYSCSVYAKTQQERMSIVQRPSSTADNFAAAILTVFCVSFGFAVLVLGIGMPFASCVVDDRGIEIIRLANDGLFLWKDIAAFSVERMPIGRSTMKVVRIHLNPPTFGKLPPSQDAADAEAPLESVTIAPGAYGLSAEAFLAIVERFRPAPAAVPRDAGLD